MLALRCCVWAVVLAVMVTVANLRPAAAQDQTWLQKNHRERPDRYEGLLDQSNAKREYDVLGFFARMAYSEKLPENPHSDLCVSYFPPPSAPDSDANIYIEARELSGHTHYLMRAGPEKPTDPCGTSSSRWSSFRWPADAVIASAHINPNYLGVVVRVGSDNEYNEELAPALFYAGAAPPDIKIAYYELVLRIQRRALNSLSYYWSYEDPHDKPGVFSKAQKKCFYSIANPCSQQDPHQTIEEGSLVKLRLNVSGVPEGHLRVHIDGSYLNSDEKLVANYRFYQAP